MHVRLDPVTKGEDGAAARELAKRLNRFENKNTWWRHNENGTMAEFDRQFDAAIERLRKQLGAEHPLVIDGKDVKRPTFETRSPADTSLIVGKWAKGEVADARAAVAAAKKAFPSWSATPWTKRCEILERAADHFTKHFYDLCAVMSIEAGKTRFEASIDVDEAIDFLRYYALLMREMNGFDVEMGKPVPNEHCRSVRKPWGVFAVVCPFNFPVAITTGMTVAALVTGNTAIVKPSGKGCLSGWWVFKLLREAGVPAGAMHFLTAADHGISNELLTSPDVDGLVFTGSKAVGMKAWQTAAQHGRPKPVIAEMGGKNAVIVSDKADMDKAVQGVFRSAFGFSGQKCSACSRVYVHKAVAKEFKDRLVKLTAAAKVGKPWQKDSYMGPVIDAHKAKLMAELVADVTKAGGKVLHGGKPMDEDAAGQGLAGNYLQPTIVAGVPLDHRVFREEFFMPFVAIAEVDSFEQGIREANAAEYGLTGGCFTEDEAEQKAFLDGIDVGVAYVNRAAGGSTAAVVNGQAFGGWKNSGSTGNGAGGRYYLTQFTREQSQTVVR
jgi:1-pyrroline-5-carboxylate dehydrogenase